MPAAIPGRPIPATVPGCVHTDLLDQDLITDPYIGMNELESHWIGHCDWRYETTVSITPELLAEEYLEVVFEGLDTVATIEFNGQEIGQAESMHLRYRFDIKPHAQEGENTLRIHFRSPQRYAESMEAEAGVRPNMGAGSNPQLPHRMIRKMACNFGWDWGPQVLTCGVWRPAYIEAWSTARLGDVRPLITRADEVRAEIDCRVQSLRAGGTGGVTVSAELIDPRGRSVVLAQQLVDGDHTSLALAVDTPQLWWPRGYGEQPLYDLKVRLTTQDGTVLDEKSHRIGLRTSAICTDPDPHAHEGLGQGETFHLRVNGKRVYCKGANWIPDDCFPHRVTPERYRQRIDQAAEANMNMLRVWGGGIYEDHSFYEYCDEVGMLVWQDFLLACSAYHEEEPFWSWFEAEARDNVARLSPHPSLVMWCGCNENIWATFDWSDAWRAIREEGELTWGLGYYLELFPKVVSELAPTTPYWPGSPYSSSMDRHPNANEYGDVHIWDVWNGQGDYRNYLGHFPRFASEFGYQGPCTWPTLERSIPESQRQWMSDAMQHHNKQEIGQQLALNRIADDFEGFSGDSDLGDIWFLASLNQCRALTLGCEWFRALSPWCSGALYWQLNDCWPVTSWAAIDGDGRRKLMWYATREFFRDRLVSVLPAAVSPREEPLGAMAVYLHNDTDEAWSDRVRVGRYHVDGRLLDEADFKVEVASRGTQKITLDTSWTTDAGELIVAEASGNRGWWFFGHDRDTPYAQPDFRTRLERDGDVVRFTVLADVVVRDLCVLVDRLSPEARTDRQVVNLLPGESVTFTITGVPQVSEQDLSSAEVLRCVNRLAHKHAAAETLTPS